MKHLISPLDLSVEELDQLLDLAQDIEANQKNMPMHAMEKNLLRSSMNRVPVPV